MARSPCCPRNSVCLMLSPSYGRNVVVYPGTASNGVRDSGGSEISIIFPTYYLCTTNTCISCHRRNRHAPDSPAMYLDGNEGKQRTTNYGKFEENPKLICSRAGNRSTGTTSKLETLKHMVKLTHTRINSIHPPTLQCPNGDISWPSTKHLIQLKRQTRIDVRLNFPRAYGRNRTRRMPRSSSAFSFLNYRET